MLLLVNAVVRNDHVLPHILKWPLSIHILINGRYERGFEKPCRAPITHLPILGKTLLILSNS